MFKTDARTSISVTWGEPQLFYTIESKYRPRLPFPSATDVAAPIATRSEAFKHIRIRND